ncbi:hypothetical protein ASZ90_004610 [hydrocarbon metagenome]|uniref:Uncharacterized protein n=1 Tax=hydrocarbon metagenome TaxID=938273 RepID=A0A0W8FXB8_9ZZZZ
MYFKDSTTDITIRNSFTGLLAVIISGLLVLVFGILPDTLFSIIYSVLSF